MIFGKIHILQTVIEFRIKSPVSQRQLQVGQLVINVGGTLLDLPVMHLEQLLLQAAARHPVN
ncbi:hypothetical protein D3C76_1511720 [compost metagenome]